jgi:hypothetical protein
MGGQDEQQYSNIANSITNNALESIANYCSITCNDNISNLDVVIVGGNDTVNINQSCSIIGAECLIKNIMSTQIDNLVSNIINQKQLDKSIFDLLGPATSETVSITNALKNQMSQLITSTCSISSDNSISNVGVFSQDANLDLKISQTGTINNTQCILDTVSKILINNDIKNNVEQSTSGLSIGKFIIIVILICIIIALVIFGPFLAQISQIGGDVISNVFPGSGR